jgi:hypothetical protein
MSDIATKRIRFYRLLLAALCVCLVFSSLASAHGMAPHDLAPVDLAHDTAQHDEAQIDFHIEHHKSNLQEQAHDCCDHDEGPCSTSSDCATHCIASMTQKPTHLFPVTNKSGFEIDVSPTSALFLPLDGPFKPPR